MQKLICTVGIQGCGKSTWAREYVNNHQDHYRVNGDDTRAMLYGSGPHDVRWSPKKEAAVNASQEGAVKGLLAAGYHVIWDNMNVSKSAKARCERVATEAGAGLMWKYFDTSIDECIDNDIRRGRPIGRAIIENTALYNDLVPWNHYRDLIIVDVDGTLTDCEWRRQLYLDNREHKDWKNFLELAYMDKPREPVVRWVQELSKNYDIIIVSGRNELYDQGTENQLWRFGVPYKRIFMRRNNDHRHDWEVKCDVLSHIPKEKIVFAIDDRPRVVKECWRKNGIKVYPVGGYETYW